MDNLFVVKFENQIEVMTFTELFHFLNVAVLSNKDITTFSVINLALKPISLKEVSSIVAHAAKKGITLKGGELVGKNFDYMYLYV